MALLKSNEFKCNAAGRRFMAERVKVSKPRPVTTDMDTLRYAEEIGGLKPGSEFKYPNAQGGTSKAVVCSSTHLNFLSTALIFAAGSGVFFCAQPRSAGGVGSGKPRGVKGFGAGFPGLREAVESHVRTGRGCGKLCAGGQPGRLCGRAGASVRTGRGANRFSAWR